MHTAVLTNLPSFSLPKQSWAQVLCSIENTAEKNMIKVIKTSLKVRQRVHSQNAINNFLHSILLDRKFSFPTILRKNSLQIWKAFGSKLQTTFEKQSSTQDKPHEAPLHLDTAVLVDLPQSLPLEVVKFPLKLRNCFACCPRNNLFIQIWFC